MDVGEVGGVVGMKFRGVDKTSDSTRLEVLTEGLLSTILPWYAYAKAM